MVDKSLFAGVVKITELPALRRAVDVAVGRSQVCALANDGALTCVDYAWNAPERSWVFGTPRREPGSWRDVDAGSDMLCAVTRAGEVRCSRGMVTCSNANESTRPAPVQLQCTRGAGLHPLPTPALAQTVATSWLGGCAKSPDDRVACWGENALFAQRGTTPAQPIAQLSGVTSIAASNTHACAVRKSGDLFCWAAVRGVWATGATGRDVVRVPTAHPVRDVGLKDGVTCWVEAEGNAYCRRRAEPAVLLSENVAEIAVGAQTCTRHRNQDVTCWVEPVRTPAQEGDVLVTGSATLFTGGGVHALGNNGATGLFDLGIRAEALVGKADRAAELTFGLGPLVELRSRSLSTAEVALGLTGLISPAGAGNPCFTLGALAGYAARPRLSEPFIAALTRVGLRQAVVRKSPRSRAHYAMHVDLYASGRYGMHSGTLEVTGGLELDLWLPVAAAKEM